MCLENSTLNGQDAKIIFDTGAAINIIADTLVEKYDLIPMEIETRVKGFQSSPGRFAMAKELKIGNLTAIIIRSEMKKLLIILLSFLGMNACMNAQNKSYTDMDVDTFAKYIANGDVQLVDVRTPEEYSEGHIEGARNINLFDDDFIEKAQAELDSSRPVAVYCRSGKRSAEAAQKLSGKGFKVANLKGGILAWDIGHHFSNT